MSVTTSGQRLKSVLRRYPRDVRITPARGPPRVIAVRPKSRTGREQPQQTAQLFDHLVGTQQNRGWQIDPDRLCSLEVEDELEFGRLLDR